MRSIYNRSLWILTVAILVVGTFAGTLEASTITVTPTSQTIAPGGTASVDIVLSGLAAGETVGGFSFLLSFNPSILGAVRSFVANPDGKMGALPLDLSGGFPLGGSPLDVFYLADAAISQPALKTLEGTGFRLARVTFTGAAQGLSPLTLSVSPTTGVFLSDYLGTGTVAATAVNGSVCVATPGNVCTATTPEPSTMSLMLFVGLIGLAFAVKRHRLSAEV